MNGSIMKWVNVSVALSIVTCLCWCSVMNCFTSSNDLFASTSPYLPLLPNNWSGFTTRFVLRSQGCCSGSEARLVSGVMATSLMANVKQFCSMFWRIICFASYSLIFFLAIEDFLDGVFK